MYLKAWNNIHTTIYSGHLRRADYEKKNQFNRSAQCFILLYKMYKRLDLEKLRRLNKLDSSSEAMIAEGYLRSSRDEHLSSWQQRAKLLVQHNPRSLPLTPEPWSWVWVVRSWGNMKRFKISTLSMKAKISDWSSFTLLSTPGAGRIKVPESTPCVYLAFLACGSSVALCTPPSFLHSQISA